MSRKCPKCGGKTVSSGVGEEYLCFMCNSQNTDPVREGCEDSCEVARAKLNVSDQVVAEMLARVAAGYTPGNLVPTAGNTAKFAKQVVESLLLFRVER